MKLEQHSYGKERVRITTLDRSVSPHGLFIGAVDISLEGDFDAAFTDGDNRSVVATDSMKNTVYVLAREQGVKSVEQFAGLLATHFVKTYDVVSSATVVVEAERWQPIEVSSEALPDAQVRSGADLDFASASATRDSEDERSCVLLRASGFEGLQVIKTAKSAFSDFFRDRFSTLQDTDDRLFATSIRAEWLLSAEALAPDGTDLDQVAEDDHNRREKVRSVLLKAFARHQSRSVQETLYAMGGAVLEAMPEVEEIHLELPNQHHLSADLEPFELDNPNQVFVGTHEPFGTIQATLRR